MQVVSVVVVVVVVSPCDKCASQIEENWTKSVKNIKRIINTWEKGNMSIASKVCIIKTCLISQFVYHASTGSPRSCSNSGKQIII